MAERGKEVLDKLSNLDLVTVALINGACLGGGLELALSCKYRVASFSSTLKIGLPEVRLGIIPGWGGTQRLRHLVGLGPAYELILSGRMIDADEAHRIGLVNAVVPPEELLPAAEKLAASILANGPQAVARAMYCIRAGMNESLDRGLQLELKAFSELFETPETQEGLAAFVEKRKPRFR